MVDKQVKIDIRLCSKSEILAWFLEMGEKKFRAKQVYEWLWQKGVHSFAEMTNLSKALREKLETVENMTTEVVLLAFYLLKCCYTLIYTFTTLNINPFPADNHF